jgi:hypothetical protein
MFLSTLGKPGPARIGAVWLLGGLAAGIALLLAFLDHGEPIETAVAIGAVSLLLFTVAAVLTFDCVRAWHCVDYAWVATTFMTVVVALSNISENNRLRNLRDARLHVLAAFSDLIYTNRQILENDCKAPALRPVGYKPSPLPYEGACQRMDRILPQMEQQYRDADRGGSTEVLKTWTRAALCLPGSSPQGAWSELCEETDRLKTKTTELSVVLADNLPSTSAISRLTIDGGIRYWYFAMAFVVGVRLSLVTAVLLRTPRSPLPD